MLSIAAALVLLMSLGKVLLCCLVDIWCDLHPGVSAFTWCRPNGALASNIDLIGCPYVWVPYITSADILPYPFSNHCVLSFSWVLPDSVPMGPGLWKLNLGILEEDEFVTRITDFWFIWQRCQSGFSTLTQWWDAGKSHMKHLRINYCKNRNTSQCTERNILTNLVAHLKTHADSGRLSLLPICLSTLSCLDAFDCEVVRGAKLCFGQGERKRVSPALHIFSTSKRNGLRILRSRC